jgi:hypothetical protein
MAGYGTAMRGQVDREGRQGWQLCQSGTAGGNIDHGMASTLPILYDFDSLLNFLLPLLVSFFNPHPHLMKGGLREGTLMENTPFLFLFLHFIMQLSLLSLHPFD